MKQARRPHAVSLCLLMLCACSAGREGSPDPNDYFDDITGAEDAGSATGGDRVPGSSSGSTGSVASGGANENTGASGSGGSNSTGSSGSSGAAGSTGGSTGGANASGGTAGGPTASDVRVDQIQVTGTHNSYHQAPTIAFDDSHKYTHKPLDQQLEGGVRTFELDLHMGTDGEVHVYHIAAIDNRTSCERLEDCLKTIDSWRANNPKHVPIFVWFEVKDSTGGSPFSNLNIVEETISRVFSRTEVLTPDDLKGSYASANERIVKEGWPKIDDARGKMIFIVLNRDDHAKKYTSDFTTLAGKLMFANAAPDQYDLPWAAITKEGPAEETMKAAHARHMLIATNTCGINQSSEDCDKDRAAAMSAGIHMLKDDVPFMISGRSDFLQLPMGSPGCNPVTANATCNAANLE